MDCQSSSLRETWGCLNIMNSSNVERRPATKPYVLMYSKCRNLLILIIPLLFLSGCIRYVTPQSEMAKGSNSKRPANLAGKTEFEAYEKSLSERLVNFVSQRRGGLGGSDSSYRIGAGDVFEMSVFEFPDLRQDAVEVANDGTVSLPLITERIRVEGLSVAELRSTLESRYTRFIRNPKVIVNLKGYASSSVAVTGAVTKPGTYPLRRQGTLLNDILAEAGGRTDKAGNRVLLVPSGSAGTAEGAVEIDYASLLGSVNAAPTLIPLRGGDTIIVPEAGTYEVAGEVETPGSYKITGRTTAFGAIAAAGGFTYGAKIDEVEIIRDIGAGRKAVMALNLEEVALTENQDIPVRDGDVIRVPTASGRHFQRQLVEGLNSVFRGVGVSAR